MPWMPGAVDGGPDGRNYGVRPRRDGLADCRKECADVVDEQLRLLEGGEVPTTRHRRPMRDVVDGLAPGARRAEHFTREIGYASRQFDPVEVSPRLEALPVQARRGSAGTSHPVDHHVVEDLVSAEHVLGMPVAVHPRPELLDDPGQLPHRRVDKSITKRLRSGGLLLGIAGAGAG